MRRTILAMAFIFFPSAAFAIQWPWQETPETRYEYCRGFLATSLGAYPVQGLSRVRLWLAWNEVVKETSLDFDPNGQEYLEGRQFFNTRLEAGDSQAIIDQADGACALGTG